MTEKCVTLGPNAKFDPAGIEDRIELNGLNGLPLKKISNEQIEGINYLGISSEDISEGVTIPTVDGNMQAYRAKKEESTR